ncbi:hypothetical protein NBRC3280_2923 [Acetobacter pasteurianus NBRC 3280]|uniref:Uncharacterized protein n=1 Tax=Acetobacter pasteurianus NBRC 3278 TaxID=1226660 RepID=A0A401X7S0_ACEPA|nr:hypothetical protein NBRC3278_2919 [Acetobacter pasteurianus NBRC 3278]GCD70288.1 hypothetical protein NBRC3280_2923 [Acetobacter pasteurianus NBRC 3280]
MQQLNGPLGTRLLESLIEFTLFNYGSIRDGKGHILLDAPFKLLNQNYKRHFEN